MADEAPLVLKLAPLPRSQIGPFLLLGVDKDAANEAIEANWAQRLIWARKNQGSVPLEDINWAREVLNDAERRLRSDSQNRNVDTTEGTLKKLVVQFQEAAASCLPIDVEPDLSNYRPSLPTATLEEVRAQTSVPPIPREMPAVPSLLREANREPLDPWGFSLEVPGDDA